MDLGLEVETFREARCGCSSLGYRVRVDLIGRDYELEISETLLMWTPENGLSRYGIVVFMCMVTSRRVGCGCTVWLSPKVSVYTPSMGCVGLHVVWIMYRC